MCGIVGIINEPDGASGDCTTRMLKRIAHRGPDAEGRFADSRLALGVRRLSIIDIEGGKQPVHNEDGTVHAVMNGTIYCFEKLRSELIERGHVFKSRCDTEVLVHGYEEWSIEGLLSRIDGMFAFALYDQRRDLAFIARDRIGIKPLYYSEQNGSLFFASEIASLLASGRIPVQPDPDGVRLFLQLRYVPAPLTVLAQVSKLPPGHYMQVPRKGPVELKRYWSPAFAPHHDRTAEQWCQELKETISDVVATHMIGDVDVGVYLSGGIDSSIVLGVASRLIDRPVRAYSIGFETARDDETGAAVHAANRFGAHLETCHLSPPMVAELVAGLAQKATEPIADPAFLPTLALSRLAAESIKVVQTGEGADELFAGYHYYGRWARPFAQARESGRQTARMVADGLRLTGQHASARSPGSGQPHIMPAREVDRYLADLAVQPDRDRVSAGAFERQYTAGTASLHPLNRASLVDISGWLPDNLLAKVDRATMAFGVEARVPFLDMRVIDCAQRMPHDVKYRSERNKWILREAFGEMLGPVLSDRPKHGLSVPMADWLRGPLRDICMDRLGTSAGKTVPWINTDATSALLQTHMQGEDHSARLWTLFTLADWFRSVRAA
ncbi:MAG TPA: asparagine synthase (glutamine-hydrolyzing) [Candidatus Krumholzibacteria bacterium]|nr:asparagine synthase (glutamine-hydrolyzing) [Candidatus Krumholzibacteria bacterium]